MQITKKQNTVHVCDLNNATHAKMLDFKGGGFHEFTEELGGDGIKCWRRDLSWKRWERYGGVKKGGCGGFNKEGYFERKYTKRGEWGCI